MKIAQPEIIYFLLPLGCMRNHWIKLFEKSTLNEVQLYGSSHSSHSIYEKHLKELSSKFATNSKSA
jgi:hypothetical protein